MTIQPIRDKRQRKRYLCDEFFVQCTFQTPDGDLAMTAIDFSKEGMGLFSSEMLPESEPASLCLCYQNPSLQLKFNALPCMLVYYNQTEVGSQCGIRFSLEQISQADEKALEAIELVLAELDDPDDRYHLLHDD